VSDRSLRSGNKKSMMVKWA